MSTPVISNAQMVGIQLRKFLASRPDSEGYAHTGTLASICSAMSAFRCPHRILFVLLSVLALGANKLPAQPGLSNSITEARSIIKTEIEPRVPGLSVAVAMDGKIVWSEAFGLADVETKTPVTPSTRFRIGSISKPLTSAGLALLVERGKIDMDAPIQKYIPDFPQKEGPITVRMLAGHLSGIRNYRVGERGSVQQAVSEFAGGPEDL